MKRCRDRVFLVTFDDHLSGDRDQTWSVEARFIDAAAAVFDCMYDDDATEYREVFVTGYPSATMLRGRVVRDMVDAIWERELPDLMP